MKLHTDIIRTFIPAQNPMFTVEHDLAVANVHYSETNPDSCFIAISLKVDVESVSVSDMTLLMNEVKENAIGHGHYGFQPGESSITTVDGFAYAMYPNFPEEGVSE